MSSLFGRANSAAGSTQLQPPSPLPGGGSGGTPKAEAASAAGAGGRAGSGILAGGKQPSTGTSSATGAGGGMEPFLFHNDSVVLPSADLAQLPNIVIPQITPVPTRGNTSRASNFSEDLQGLEAGILQLSDWEIQPEGELRAGGRDGGREAGRDGRRDGGWSWEMGA